VVDDIKLLNERAPNKEELNKEELNVNVINKELINSERSITMIEKKDVNKDLLVLYENLDEIKRAKQTIAEGTLALWNIRLEAMIAAGFPLKDILKNVDDEPTNVCGCEDGGAICVCPCSYPNMDCNCPTDYFGRDHLIYNMNQSIVNLAQEIKLIGEKIK